MIEKDDKNTAIKKETATKKLGIRYAGIANQMIKIVHDLYSSKFSSWHSGKFKRFQYTTDKKDVKCFYDMLGEKLLYNKDTTGQEDVRKILKRGIPEDRLEDFFSKLSEALVDYTNSLSDFNNEGEKVKKCRDSVIEELSTLNSSLNTTLKALDIQYVNHQVNASDKEDLRKRQIEDFKKELKGKYKPMAEQELKKFIDSLGYPNDGDTQQEQWSVRLSFIKKKQN